MRCVFQIDEDPDAVWSEDLDQAPDLGDTVEHEGRLYVVSSPTVRSASTAAEGGELADIRLSRKQCDAVIHIHSVVVTAAIDWPNPVVSCDLDAGHADGHHALLPKLAGSHGDERTDVHWSDGDESWPPQ